MNYDHAYHAGNFADVLKHSVLCLALEHLNRKAKPYCVIDTHAGAGRYALAGEESRKTGEAARGIVRLWDPTAPFGLTQATSSPALAPYLDCLKAFGAEFSRSGGVPDDYPGSPLI
ncbi:MAG: 23S rRNA (adenine(2030)-N(6))-methyltransferase RlmJ, partial [Rhodospirillaceae bacterium]